VWCWSTPSKSPTARRRSSSLTGSTPPSGCASSPGFVSSRLHQSLDPDAEFRYVNVAEWESADHFGKAAASPEFQQHISGMTVQAHPALYRVVIQ
jgi:hypothetical protein